MAKSSTDLNNLPYFIGKVEVFPKDRSRLKKKKKPYEEETIVVNTKTDIVNYYSKLFYKTYGVVLIPPGFGAHVTVNNGRQKANLTNSNLKLLQKINNKSVKLYYDPTNMYLIGRQVIIKVQNNKFLDSLRKVLNLPEKTDYHITIGTLPEAVSVPSSDGKWKQLCVGLVL